LQIGKNYLFKELGNLNLQVESCFGWMTRDWRNVLGLEKSHVNDAIAIVCQERKPKIASSSYLLIPKRKKLWEHNPTKLSDEKYGFRHWDLVTAEHRSKGKVIGSVRSLKAKAMTLRTTWNNNFEVSYRKAKLLWRFKSIIYISEL
jgi:hypothetical protein